MLRYAMLYAEENARFFENKTSIMLPSIYATSDARNAYMLKNENIREECKVP